MAPKIIDHSVTLKTKTGSVDGGRKFWRKWNKFGIGALRPPGGHLSKGTSALWVPTVQYSILEFYRSVFFSLQWLEGHSYTCFPSGYWLMVTTQKKLPKIGTTLGRTVSHCRTLKRNTFTHPTLHWRCALAHQATHFIQRSFVQGSRRVFFVFTENSSYHHHHYLQSF